MLKLRKWSYIFAYLEVGFFHSWLLLQHTDKHLTRDLLLAHGFHHLKWQTVTMNTAGRPQAPDMAVTMNKYVKPQTQHSYHEHSWPTTDTTQLP